MIADFRPWGIASGMEAKALFERVLAREVTPARNANTAFATRSAKSADKREACEARARVQAVEQNSPKLSLAAQRLLLDKTQAEAERDMLLGASDPAARVHAQLVIHKHYIAAAERSRAGKGKK